MTVYANISAESHSISAVLDGETIDGSFVDLYGTDYVFVDNSIITPAGAKYFRHTNPGSNGAANSALVEYYPTVAEFNLVPGTTYYVAQFCRFQEIDGLVIWHNNDDYDKLLEMRGAGFRFIIESGFADGQVVYVDTHKTTFTISVAKSVVPSWPYYDHVPPNVNPYNSSNPPYCNMNVWIAVVLATTTYANSNGRTRLWVNGHLTSDYSGQNMETGATLSRLGTLGTIGQNEYITPSHIRQWDGILLVSDDGGEPLTNGIPTILYTNGYMQDPEEGGSASGSLTHSGIVHGRKGYMKRNVFVT